LRRKINKEKRQNWSSAKEGRLDVMAKGTSKKRRARLAKKETSDEQAIELRNSNESFDDEEILEGIFILSNEILVEILLQLNLVDIVNLSMVNRKFRNLIDDDVFWKFRSLQFLMCLRQKFQPIHNESWKDFFISIYIKFKSVYYFKSIL